MALKSLADALPSAPIVYGRYLPMDNVGTVGVTGKYKEKAISTRYVVPRSIDKIIMNITINSDNR